MLEHIVLKLSLHQQCVCSNDSPADWMRNIAMVSYLSFIVIRKNNLSYL